MIKKSDIMFVIGLGLGSFWTILVMLVNQPVIGWEEFLLGALLVLGIAGLCLFGFIMNHQVQ